jgi:hypothetical protein
VFDARPVSVKLVVDKVIPKHVFLQALRFSPVFIYMLFLPEGQQARSRKLLEIEALSGIGEQCRPNSTTVAPLGHIVIGVG